MENNITLAIVIKHTVYIGNKKLQINKIKYKETECYKYLFSSFKQNYCYIDRFQN